MAKLLWILETEEVHDVCDELVLLILITQYFTDITGCSLHLARKLLILALAETIGVAWHHKDIGEA